MKAREVYWDCIYARDCLEAALTERRLKDAKVMWFAALAMLRAIGHVLESVDAKNLGEDFKRLSDRKYREWNESHPIFYGFIKKERDSILKEYDSSLGEETLREESPLELSDGSLFVLSSGDVLGVTTEFSTLTKQRGELAGESPAEVLTRALEWWDQELTLLEDAIK